MSCSIRARLACAALVLSALPAHAGSLVIDLPAAITRAREHAPRAIAARGRIGEARARRDGAGALLTEDLELEVGAGRRTGGSLALEAQISRPLELGRRGPRIGVADAELAHARALDAAELREVTYDAATSFYEARFADLVVELAQRDQEVASRVVDAAARRRKAGDVTDLDVNLARIALGRARSTVAAARGERAAAIGRLGALIGARPEDTITLAGDLKPAGLTLAPLRAGIATRADLRAIAAEGGVARAERALATANGRPDLGLWLGYQRDEGDTILLGGITLVLPFGKRGARAAAGAKLARSEDERAAIAGAASRQVGDVFEAYQRARESVEIFEREVLPPLADSEKLLERSVETGQITINDFLVVRQEILNGRREYLERQLGLARAAATVRFVAGVTP